MAKRLVPVVRIKKDSKRKNPYLVYYRQFGKVVYCGYERTKRAAETLKTEEQGKLYERYGTVEARSSKAKFGDFLEDFLAYHERKRSAPDTIAFYKQKLDYLKGKIGAVSFDALAANRDIVKLAIKDAGNGQVWERGVLTAFGTYMNWGHSRNPPLCPPSFSKFVDLEHRREDRHKNYYLPGEVAQLFAHCLEYERRTGEVDRRKHVLALRFFAGIRMRELDRMTCEYVRKAERRIHMTDSTGKTAGILKDLPGVIWLWLADLPGEGRIYDGVTSEVIRNVKRYHDLPEVKGATARRTFATMASNLYGCEQARKWMRHSDKLSTMETHYLGAVVHREGKPTIADERMARHFFALSPWVVGMRKK